ncbi:MAG TPA: HesA/MoeB/ThiF family protein [Desulfobacteraceae bacterium]|nr:HesA/MoeB/ThiF family protein [Deltaproteobacteria bacterium]HDI61109.1 HesA/MoeB/ThiF family protein [Desulfobacteraceae bacterium]
MTPPQSSSTAAAHEDGQRYLRNRESITEAQQAMLRRAHVAVVGLGGLGGATVEILARIGVGALTLVDGDRFEATNLNRQLLCTAQTLGLPKAEAAADRISLINPSVRVHCVPRHLEAKNAAEVLGGSHLVMDCLDNLPARFTVQAAARQLDIPMVSAAVAGASGQLTIIEPQDPGLETIYGPAESTPERGAEIRLGVLPYTVIALASLACSEAIKRLLGIGTGLRRKLLLVDLLGNRFDIVEI